MRLCRFEHRLPPTDRKKGPLRGVFDGGVGSARTVRTAIYFTPFFPHLVKIRLKFRPNSTILSSSACISSIKRKRDRIIRHLSTNLKTPVSVKIRIFPEVEKTVRYAKMFEKAGASLIAVHGRTRDQKNPCASRADWDQIRAVKQVYNHRSQTLPPNQNDSKHVPHNF